MSANEQRLIAVVTILFALLACVAAWIVIPPTWMSVFSRSAPLNFYYQVRVISEGTETAIQNATVTVEGEGVLKSESTDSTGLARILIASSLVGKPGTLTIEAGGYERHRRHLDLTKDVLPHTIYLKPVAATYAPTPEPTETPTLEPTSTSEPTKTLTPEPTHTSTPEPTTTPTPASVQPTSAVAEAPSTETLVPSFKDMVFCTEENYDKVARRCTTSEVTFGQIPVIYVSWTYANVYTGMPFRREWYKDKNPTPVFVNDGDWVEGWEVYGVTEGTHLYSFGMEGSPPNFPPGDYRVELYIGETIDSPVRLELTGFFTVEW